jgi:hypothetical protein
MGSVLQAKTGQGADISGSFDTRRCALALITNVYNSVYLTVRHRRPFRDSCTAVSCDS